MTDYWWVELWEELCLDAWERLGTSFGELPIRVALTWARSIALLEGTHVNLRLKLMAQEREDKSEAMSGPLVGSLGGTVTYSKSTGSVGDYWERMKKEYLTSGS